MSAQLHGKLLRLGPSILCVAAGATAYQLFSPNADTKARCEVPLAAREPPPPATAVTVNTLRRWLEQQGADIDAIDFKPSPTDEGRFGIFANQGVQRKAARGWWGGLKAALTLGRAGRNANVALASFPLEGALTARNVLLRGGQQAEVLRELSDLGVVDGRTLVMLHLVVERLRGRDSKLCPWIALLPKTFGSTLFFGERELEWLKATTLHRATVLRQRALAEQWRRLEPACRQLALQEGVEAQPGLHDFLWAYSVFWSRAISFPCPTEGGGVEMEEGIIPGLDFANHNEGSPAKWTVFGASDRPGKAPPTDVTLICPRKAVPKPGEEVAISYGPKGNEELLFLYGFALRDNPHDVLHVPCPIPNPEEWDEKMTARMQLLSLRGLRPHLFLPAEFLAEQRAHQAASARQRRRKQRDTSGQDPLGAGLPEGVFETLEVFTMEGRQLNQELARLAEGGTEAAGAAAQGRRELRPVEASGLRLAVLTTLVRLLEIKMLAQEGEEGTGPLEADTALLAAADVAPTPGHPIPAPRLSAAERHALYYRMGQKALTREYLLHARGLLEREMQQLRVLMGPENAEP